MNRSSRRQILTAALASAAGVTGLAAAATIASRYGLIPPNSGELYGPGDTLTYASQRLLTRHAVAREFTATQISPRPFANGVGRLSDSFHRSEQTGFSDWQLAVGGMVARPSSFSLGQIKQFPASTQITHLACEEGWSYIAQWSGARLSDILHAVGTLPAARYVVYHSVQPGWWESIDMADALHPQTLLTYYMNGGDLPVKFGGPLRMRVPRQLAYKSLKYVTRLTLTDNLRSFGRGLGSSGPESGYSWYAGI